MVAEIAHPFTFENDFGEERRVGSTMRRKQDSVALQEAEQRGYAAGFAAGQAAQEQSDAARQAMALETIALQLQRVDHDMAQFFMACENEAAKLAETLAYLHGDLLAGFNPHAGFLAAARDVMGQFPDATRLIARVPVDLRGSIEERLTRLAQDMRFAGRLIVESLSGPHEPTDFIFDWPEGAIRHDSATLRARLTEEFQHYGFAMMDEERHD